MEKRKDNKGRVLKEGEYQYPNLRYRFRYKDSTGHTRTIYSWRLIDSDKTPAGKKVIPSLREQEQIILKENFKGNNIYLASKYTFCDYFEKYMEVNSEISITTKENYLHMFSKNIKNSNFANKTLINIKHSDIDLFYSYLRNERGFTIGTIQNYQNLLFPTFQLAVKDEVIKNNPCLDAMKKFKNIDEESEREPLTIEEEKILLNFVKNDIYYKSSYPLLIAFLATGGRMGEVLGLTWDDINFKNKYISINHQAIYRKNGDKIKWRISKLKWAKNKKQNNRIIYVSDKVMDVLREYKELTYNYSLMSEFSIESDIKYRENFGLKDIYTNFLFINKNGNLRTPNTINRTFTGIVERYNKYHDNSEEDLRQFSAHILRYTFGTRNAENGMDIKVLQTLMGHKNIATTMNIYNKVDAVRLKKSTLAVDPPVFL